MSIARSLTFLLTVSSLHCTELTSWRVGESTHLHTRESRGESGRVAESWGEFPHLHKGESPGEFRRIPESLLIYIKGGVGESPGESSRVIKSHKES